MRMLFHSAEDLVRVIVVGVGAYVGLIVLLRTTGKRTLSKMNAFDLVVTVSLGSTLAATLLNADVSLSKGLTAFAVLCGLQFVVAFVSVRFDWFETVVKAQPALLYYDDAFLWRTMRRERVTREEVLAAVRAAGRPDLAAAHAVVLETDGSVSVVFHPELDAGGVARSSLDTLPKAKSTP